MLIVLPKEDVSPPASARNNMADAHVVLQRNISAADVDGDVDAAAAAAEDDNGADCCSD
jgi:hypothetical protein